MLLALKMSTEKLSTIHNKWMQKLLELVKDVLKYSDDLHKTHKQVLKIEVYYLGLIERVCNFKPLFCMFKLK